MTSPEPATRWWSFRGVWLWVVPIGFFIGVALLDATHGYIGYRLAEEPAVGMTLRGQSLTWPSMFARVLPSWLLVGVLTPFVILLVRRYPISWERSRAYLLVHLAAAVGFAFAFLCGAAAMRYGLFLRQEVETSYRLVLLRYYAVYFNTFFLNYWALVGVYSAFRYHARHREALLLEKRLTEARLHALQAQLRPHFLFNSLNAISTLAREGDRRVVELLAGLAELLRASFRDDATQLIPLDEELTLAERYLELEQLRFPDRLTVRITVDPATGGTYVPRLVLQPLVENAVRHGIAAKAHGGRIAIDCVRIGDTLELRISDTGPGPGEGSGMGLSITRSRLQELFPGRASLDLDNAPGGGTVVTVRLPIVHRGSEAAA